MLPLRSVGRSNFDKGRHNLTTLIKKPTFINELLNYIYIGVYICAYMCIYIFIYAYQKFYPSLSKQLGMLCMQIELFNISL